MRKAYEKANTFDKKNYKKLPDTMVPGARGRMKKVKGDTPAAQVYKKQQNVLRRKLGTGKESVDREVVEAIQKDLEDEGNKFVNKLPHCVQRCVRWCFGGVRYFLHRSGLGEERCRDGHS
ncbi:unnamed protein product [Cercospora beticola]|nr:unnamed protein product [Cercospora beticola]